MAETKGQRSRGAGSAPGVRREPAGDLIPSKPLTGREALLQLVLLLGIPLILLFLARFVLRQLFPSLGY